MRLTREAPDDGAATKRRSGLATLGLVVLSVALFVLGALLVIMGTTGVFDVRLLGIGIMPELPGLIVIAAGVYCQFHAGRPARGGDGD